jgi:hypothetical protein
MVQKGRAIQIQKSVVTDLMSHLASLPEREKGPDDPISLPEIFRTKEYMAEMRGALKKGYTFEDLAEIFSKRCGVFISVRQLKYHYTRGTLKPQKKRHSLPKPPQKNGIGSEKENAEPNDSLAEVYSKGTGMLSGNDGTAKVKPGTFSIDMEQEEIW